MGKFDRAPVDRAAGGVVSRGGEILVVHRPRYDDWSLPKGHVERGESWAEAARREVLEETGVPVDVTGGPIPVSYMLDGDTAKVVVFFPMRVQSPHGGDVVVDADGDEVDAALWWDVAEALERLTYDVDRDVVRRALGDMDAGGPHRR